MNAKNFTTNQKVLAIIIGVAIIATAGVSVASAQVQGTQSQQPPTIQGSINLQQTIMSNVQTKFSTASDTAASAVTNGKTIGGSLTVVQGFVVYSFKVIDDKNMVYSVIVDPANGTVLYTSPGHSFQLGGFGMGSFAMGGQHGTMKHRFHIGGNPQNSSPSAPGSTTPSSGSLS
ncbi:MAG: PepSY domain-containing protein [Thaumarchaeota archaeon]|nr:PepSY domain-containing protein [Nitrososphaerota archaeon]